ncbi:MAG: hypothetical protein WBD86_02145 [Microgenomates group bacterium]
MEKIYNPESKNPNLNFTRLVTKIIDDTKLLAETDKSNPDFLTLEINKGEHLVIRIQDIDKKGKSLHKLYQRLNLEPQSVRNIEIFYNPLQLDGGNLVSATFNFTEEEWKNRTVTRLIKAGTFPSEALANPSRRSPQEGLYPAYDRDTIDWSKMPQRTPIAAEEVIKLLEKIKDKVSPTPR